MSKTGDNGILKKETSMNKCINFCRFWRYMVDDEKLVKQGAEIMKAILEAHSPRLTNISEKMGGKSERGYKAIQRFIQQVDLKKMLMRFYAEKAEFVMGDPTE